MQKQLHDSAYALKCVSIFEANSNDDDIYRVVTPRPNPHQDLKTTQLL